MGRNYNIYLYIIIFDRNYSNFTKKNIRKDINNYNYQVVQIEDIDNISNFTENNWKQVSGDVFRPPRVNKMLLSSIIGTGFQLFLMLYIVFILGSIGFLEPEKRENILSLIIIFYGISKRICFSKIL